MNQQSAEFLEKSSRAFQSDFGTTLQTVRDRVADEAAGTRRRDTLSALDALPRLLGRELVTVKAVPAALRKLFDSRNAAQLDISEKRLANIRSLVGGAARKHGDPVAVLTKRLPISAEWTALLDLVGVPDYRSALRRLACFCTAMGIAPDEVCADTLKGFYEALQAEEVLKNPRAILHNTVSYWNGCEKRIPGWPPFRLASPFPRNRDILPLQLFPVSFQQDLQRWQDSLLRVDVLDDLKPRKVVRAVTAELHRGNLLRFASVLVAEDLICLEEATGLAVVVKPETAKAGLRVFLRRASNKPTGYIRQYAQLLYGIATKYCQLPPADLEALRGFVRRLDIGKTRGMRPGVAEKLKPFDDPANYRKLLAYSFEERDRGLKQRNPIKKAKYFDRAIAAAILIHLAVRIKNLCNIRIDKNLRQAGGTWYLSYIDEEMKGDRPHELELSKEVGELLLVYLKVHRPLLPGASGPYLFAGESGGPRHHSALRAEFKKGVLRHTGLKVNPHLTRHILGKLIAENDPALIPTLSQHLGHASVQTTIDYYLENDGRPASRTISKILEATLAKPTMLKRRRW